MLQPTLTLERSKALVCRNLFNDASELLKIDRFEIVRTLGSGGMGSVYEAVDAQRGERVALKVLNGRDAADLYRLKREFRALAALAHPNLVAVHELSIARQHVFFTMEIVRGLDIVSYARQGASPAMLPDDARLRDALSQLCDGIVALHGAGKLHRDLKPSNVLVTQAGRVVLLDFGLVQDVSEQAEEIAGTPAYMAPEQRAGKACESSDWYAFGRILQRALCGGPLPGLRTSTRRMTELARLAERLLDPEPSRRPGWQEVSSIVRGSDAVTVRTSVSSPASGSFVGRTKELSLLGRALCESRQRPVLVLLRGESGIGKSTLIRQFMKTAQTSGAIVLSGRCDEHERIPHKALDSAVDELSRYLTTSAREQIASLSSEEGRALVGLFPALGRVAGLAANAAAADDDPAVSRRRGVDALKKVFRILSTARPLVLCVDDLQWSDADSGLLLAALLCDEDPPAMLVVGCERSDPCRFNPALAALYRASERAPRPLIHHELLLGALSLSEATTLAGSELAAQGSVSTTAASIALESRGNPLFVKALSRWDGAAPGRGGQVVSFDAMVEGRVRALSDAARCALELIAIARRPVAGGLIARALGLPGPAQPLLRELRRARLVNGVPPADHELLETDHERIREAVLRRLLAERRDALHEQLARALAAEDQRGAVGLPDA